MENTIDIRRKRALFRASHRGTKEMDWLLGRYAAAKLAEMEIHELSQFEQILHEADPQLQTWILDPAACPKAEYATILDALREFHNLKPST